jgi:Neuraminidase (sialidase)
MKTSNIITFSALAIIGGLGFYYLKNKKQIGASNEATIADKITESVKQVSETTKNIVETKIAELKKEESIITEQDKKESENFLKALALSSKIKELLVKYIRPQMAGENVGRYNLEIFRRDENIKQLKSDIDKLGYQYLQNGEIIKK